MAGRNRPHQPDDPLLASAKKILSSKENTFTVKDWREIVPTPKSIPTKFDPKDPFGKLAASRAKNKSAELAEGDPTSGIDKQAEDVVQLGSGSFGAMTSTLSQEKAMTEATTAPAKTKQEIAEEQAKAKIAAKAEKKAAADKAAAELKAKREAAAAEKAKKLQEQTAAREQAAKDKAAAKEAKAKERAEKAANPAASDAEGMSGALREKVQLGLYVKGKNGQLRTNDEIALALETVAVENMVPLLLETMGIAENPYPHLNQGQQSMNLRNRLRGAIRKGTKIEGTETVITLDRLKSIRDAKFPPVEQKPASEKPSQEAATESEQK